MQSCHWPSSRKTERAVESTIVPSKFSKIASIGICVLRPRFSCRQILPCSMSARQSISLSSLGFTLGKLRACESGIRYRERLEGKKQYVLPRGRDDSSYCSAAGRPAVPRHVAARRDADVPRTPAPARTERRRQRAPADGDARPSARRGCCGPILAQRHSPAAASFSAKSRKLPTP